MPLCCVFLTHFYFKYVLYFKYYHSPKFFKIYFKKSNTPKYTHKKKDKQTKLRYVYSCRPKSLCLSIEKLSLAFFYF